jgi:hypothetical protein
LEGFSTLLKEAQQMNLLRGVKFGAAGPHVTHLLFPDDSVVFLEATGGSIKTLKQILFDRLRNQFRPEGQLAKVFNILWSGMCGELET